MALLKEKIKKRQADAALSAEIGEIEGYNPKVYKRIKQVYAIISAVNILVVLISFGLIGYSLYDATRSFTCISSIEKDLLTSASAIEKIAIMPDRADDEIETLHKAFEDIEKQKKDFEDIKLDKDIKESFDDAYIVVEDYHAILKEYDNAFAAAKNDPDTSKLANFQKQMIANYKNDVDDRMQEAVNLMDEVVDMQQDDTMQIFYSTAQSVGIVFVLLLGILIIGIVVITMMERSNKTAAIALQKKAAEVERTSRKLSASRDKTKSLAFLNVLTGLRNRYGLEEDVAKMLEKENFHISNFDLDNFRSFNEVYGRNFGDEFLAQVAERLKKNFSDYAEIYNITSDEFTFVFKSHISKSQAIQLSQKIAEVMSGNFTISNVTVHLTCSGCTYHYIAGEYSSVNRLLSKMDAVMRTAKSNGGNAVLDADRF